MADGFKKNGSRSVWVLLRPVGMKAAVSLLFASLASQATLTLDAFRDFERKPNPRSSSDGVERNQGLQLYLGREPRPGDQPGKLRRGRVLCIARFYNRPLQPKPTL